MKNILITEFMNEDSVNLLKKNFNVNYNKTMFESEEKIKKEISNCEAIIVRNKTQLQKSILDNALNLKFVGRLGVGLDNIDKEYCKKKKYSCSDCYWNECGFCCRIRNWIFFIFNKKYYFI